MKNTRDLKLLRNIKTFISTQAIGAEFSAEHEIIMNIDFGERVRYFIERRCARIIYEHAIRYLWRPCGTLFIKTRQEFTQNFNLN